MFFDTKYDENKIASFNQMNTLLRCVLLFFILGAGAALYMSYTAEPRGFADHRGARHICANE